MATEWTTGESFAKARNRADISTRPTSIDIVPLTRAFRMSARFQGTYDQVHDADLPTSQPARTVPPRGQPVFHIHRAAQLGAGHKRLRQGGRHDTRGVRAGCHRA